MLRIAVRAWHGTGRLCLSSPTSSAASSPSVSPQHRNHDFTSKKSQNRSEHRGAKCLQSERLQKKTDLAHALAGSSRRLISLMRCAVSDSVAVGVPAVGTAIFYPKAGHPRSLTVWEGTANLINLHFVEIIWVVEVRKRTTIRSCATPSPAALLGESQRPSQLYSIMQSAGWSSVHSYTEQDEKHTCVPQPYYNTIRELEQIGTSCLLGGIRDGPKQPTSLLPHCANSLSGRMATVPLDHQ